MACSAINIPGLGKRFLTGHGQVGFVIKCRRWAELDRIWGRVLSRGQFWYLRVLVGERVKRTLVTGGKQSKGILLVIERAAHSDTAKYDLCP